MEVLMKNSFTWEFWKSKHIQVFKSKKQHLDKYLQNMDFQGSPLTVVLWPQASKKNSKNGLGPVKKRLQQVLQGQ